MADSRRMPSADLSKLSPVQKMYVKRVQRFNVSRANNHKRFRRQIGFVGFFLGMTSVAIYVYTLRAMKQEKLGDEYDQRAPDTDLKQA